MLSEIKNSCNVDIVIVVLGRTTDYATLKMEAETSDLCMRTQCVKEFNLNRRFNSE